SCHPTDTRPPPTSPPSPYTTLFRSDRIARIVGRVVADRAGEAAPGRVLDPRDHLVGANVHTAAAARRVARDDAAGHHADQRRARSEEHTSELQSRGHLVCRLLLEKK